MELRLINEFRGVVNENNFTLISKISQAKYSFCFFIFKICDILMNIYNSKGAFYGRSN